MTNTDHFSAYAAAYSKARPTYPPELFAWLAAQCPQHALAWDCGTGNGQAAQELATHFSLVHATDLSTKQLAQAKSNPRIRFVAAPAEASELADQSCDLVTIAQALHWFCHDEFYAEVKRVLKPSGLIAAWTYTLLDTAPEVNAVMRKFHDQTVAPWWPAERKWVDLAYRGMPFPFEEITVPAFTIYRQWALTDLLAYVSTWSATQRCMEETGRDPVAELGLELAQLWGDNESGTPSTKTIRWPLAIRCGRIGA